MSVSTTLRVTREAKNTWASHKEVWGKCTRCPLHQNVCHRVLARGTLPAEVVFVGEAPGEVEDAIGRPFVGPAGRILEALIKDSFSKYREYDFAITNVVACKPFAADEEIAAPPKEAITACAPRLANFLTSIAVPELTVALGKVAEGHLLSFQKKNPLSGFGALYHPAYILRKGGLNSLEYKRTLLSLVRLLKEYLD